MAKKDFIKKYTDNTLTQINDWSQFDGHLGSDVENFIKDKLENSVVDFEYRFSDSEYGNNQLLGKNAFGEVVCSTQIINANPTYIVDCSINSVKIGNVTYTNSPEVTVNYSDNLNAEVAFKYIRTGDLMGNTFNDTSLQTVTLAWFNMDNTQDFEYSPIQTNITPGENVTLNISSMFKYALSNKKLGITYKVGDVTNTVYLNTVFNIKQLILTYNNPYIIRSNILTGFTLKGTDGDSLDDYQWEYYLDNNKPSLPISLTGQNLSQLQLTLPSLSPGVHNLYLRVKKGSLMSNYLPISFIYQTDSIKGALALVTEVPNTINNCDMSRLFKVITTDKISGDIEIVVIKSNNQSEISNINTIEAAKKANPFKEIYMSMLASDESSKLDYTSYIEIPNVTNAKTFIKVFVKDWQNQGEAVNYFEFGTTVTYRPFKTISIVDPTGGSEHLQYTKGSILDFSQISNGNVFNSEELNPDLNVSNGLQVETTKVKEKDITLTTFKVSPTTGVFTTPKQLLRTNNSPLHKGAFSVEMAFKTYGSNDLEDHLLTIGNITLCPKHLFLNYEPQNSSRPEHIVNASRADFRMGEIQHVLITYDPDYKPWTYKQMYDRFYSRDAIKYSESAKAYPCLKVYVNGTINRVISVNDSQLSNESTLPLQIAPTNSNINLYVFRTYDKALSYDEVRRNYTSYMPLLDSKKDYYEDNNILYTENDFAKDQQASKQSIIGTISLGKCINKFRSVSNPNKIYKDRKVLLLVLPEGTLPPYYGNRKSVESLATFLVHYPEQSTDNGYIPSNYSGRLAPQSMDPDNPKGVVKAQGSSAKKYMFHNTSYSKFRFTPETEFKAEEPKSYKYYQMPGSDIKIEKLVGKVNYASSMQSHKQGATKLFHEGYVNAETHQTDWMNGGRKAVLEDDFFYFFVNVPANKLQSITWDDFKQADGTYNFENCYFLGFQTWGSAKGDKPTSGYSDATPHYLMLEGADNNNAAANFKVPWAAMQIWGNYNGGKWSSANSTNIQNYSSTPQNNLNYYHQFSGKDSKGNPEYLTGLLINDETLVFDPGDASENSTDKRADAWDVDFGCTEGDGYSEENPFFVFTDDVKNNVKRFAEFYNLIYTFDFSSLRFVNGEINGYSFNVDGEDMYKYKLVCGPSTVIKYGKNEIRPKEGDIYRWEKSWEVGITSKSQARWVPAGLYHNGEEWESLNIADICNNYVNASYKSGEFPTEYGFFSESVYNQYKVQLNNHYYAPDLYTASDLIPYQECMAEAFKIVVRHYMDVNDVAYHQAFIRLVAGTDNRAKNTYFQIVGDIYTDKYTNVDGEEVSIEKIETTNGDTKYGYFSEDTFIEVSIDGETVNEQDTFPINDISDREPYYYKKTNLGDNKIRLYQDDLDTIFKTDNNGQQIKPYYLLEPPFNVNLEHLWGDLHSGFFYNFDLLFVNEIKNELKTLLTFATGTSWPDTEGTKINEYFLTVQRNIPSIAYNHQSEIYYETAQTLYAGSTTEFYNSLSNNNSHKSWKDFTNNQVKYPVSLSHGSCLESEIEYLRDRVLMLSTYVSGAKNKTEESISFTGGSSESGIKSVDINTKYTSFIQYNYPTVGVGTVTKSDSLLQYDSILKYLYYNSNDASYDRVSLVEDIVIPNETVNLNIRYNTEALTGGSGWENTDLYKTIHITSGTDVFGGFLNFPNASTVICQDSSYKIDNTLNGTLDVVNYLENIEHLVIQNATFGPNCLDFTGCNRLKTLVLGETENIQDETYAIEIEDVLNEANRIQIEEAHSSDGFTQVILPKSSNVETVILPKCVKDIHINYYPNLQKFDFEESTKLTRITIDGRNDNIIIQYILDKFVDADTQYLEITNIPDGFYLSENVCKKLTYIDNVKLEGTINIGEPKNLATINWETKKLLVEKFGNIDSGNVTFNYTHRDVISISNNATGAMSTSGKIPIGLSIDGNRIPIVKDGSSHYLDITYSVSGLSGVKINNKYIPELTIPNGTEGECIIKTTVRYMLGGSSQTKELTTNLTIGFYVPKVGDFVYADGTFNSEFDDKAGLIGIVFYSKRLSNAQGSETYDIRVLSSESIQGYPMSPASYYINNTATSSIQNMGLKQEQYHDLLQELELSPTDYYKDITDARGLTVSGKITYSTPDADLQNTQELQYQKGYIAKANDYVLKLHQKGILSNGYIESNKDNVITLGGKTNFTTILKELNDVSLKQIQIGNKTYLKDNCRRFDYALFPAFLSALYFVPSKLSDPSDKNFGVGCWYLPDSSEIAKLILYRINSSITNTSSTDLNWNATSANTSDVGSRGLNYFKDNAFDQIALLKHKQNLISSDCSTDKGESYSYGYTTTTNQIGWMSNCATYMTVTYPGRDQLNTVFPVCRIELTRPQS